jgi:hypothetical protein
MLYKLSGSALQDSGYRLREAVEAFRDEQETEKKE